VVYGWLRFLSLVLAFASLWWIWKNEQFILLPVTALFIGLFLFILTKHLNNNDAIENLRRLIQISETEIEVLNHHFTHLPAGEEYKPENHEYANDLDIFSEEHHYINTSIAAHQNREENCL
jgi:hypothetical protein